jgi:hypothetical protein
MEVMAVGSKNAKQVTMLGGWLPPNAYKVLHVMALVSYDAPVPKAKVAEALARGDEPPVPCEYFSKASTTYETAFSSRFPHAPEGDARGWTEGEQVAAKQHDSAKKAVENAIKQLRDYGLIEQTRSARRGGVTARFTLHLDRLVEAKMRHVRGKKTFPVREENLPSSGRESSLEPPSEGRKSSSTKEENLPPDVQRDFQPSKKQAINAHPLTNKAVPPKVTTAKLGDARLPNGRELSPNEFEAERRHQSLALQKLIRDQDRAAS